MSAFHIEVSAIPVWQPTAALVAVVIISLNESHNTGVVLLNLDSWSQQVFFVDRYSLGYTVGVGLRHRGARGACGAVEVRWLRQPMEFRPA